MARKDQLRQQRSGTVMNVTSRKQESDVIKALIKVEAHLNRKFSGCMSIAHEKPWRLRDMKGNATERLGKNPIGLRAALLRESIFPLVCCGYGCDFERGSLIPDRVTTMALFGRLNFTCLRNEEGGKFNRGSFCFRDKKWSVDGMSPIMADIAERPVPYHMSRYGKERFVSRT